MLGTVSDIRRGDRAPQTRTRSVSQILTWTIMIWERSIMPVRQGEAPGTSLSAYILNGIHDHSRSHRDQEDIRGHTHKAVSRRRRP